MQCMTIIINQAFIYKQKSMCKFEGIGMMVYLQTITQLIFIKFVIRAAQVNKAKAWFYSKVDKKPKA